jgi:hypothetical protein
LYINENCLCYAQVIVQATNESGDIVLNAESAGLKGASVKISAEKPQVNAGSINRKHII